MNKLTILFCSFMGVSSISGCSSIDFFEGRTFWGSNSDTKTMSPTKDSNQSSVYDIDINESKKPLTLSDHQIESFPQWFYLYNLDTEKESTWQKIDLNTSKSFSANLSNSGVPTRWIHDLRVSDYIDLSTNHDGQSVLVEQSKDRSFQSLYTIVSANTSYYVEVTDSGPVMTRGLRLPTRLGTVELTPDSKIDDFSAIQKTAVSLFVSELLDDIDHEQEVILSKGETKLNFEYTYINPNKLGGIHILPSVTIFNDHIMTYKPD